VNEAYLWLKAIHILGVIAFMAGMLYLPRLFVYHANVAVGSPESEIFKIMERRLEKAIMRPALVVVILTGLTMAGMGNWFAAGWLSAKFALVGLLIAEYVYLIVLEKAFARDANRHAAIFYRILNEVGTLLLIGIVFLVVLKPF
jgi:protoporphyrinogen IX oxidase